MAPMRKKARSGSKKKKSSRRRPVNLPKSSDTKLPRKEINTPSEFPGGSDLYQEAEEPVKKPGYALGDFHFHSVCSDGKFRPAVVVQKAADNGVQYLSLTDHDTMAGVSEAIEEAKKRQVFCFPGVEVSTQLDTESIHILGYFSVGCKFDQLSTKLAALRVGRHARGKKMLQLLSEKFDIKLDWNRILEIAGEAAPGRPHIAQALVEGKFVETFGEAFTKYLANDGPAYAEGVIFPPEDAIKMINEEGGISVLAHPWCCRDAMSVIPYLASKGLQGVEVYNSAEKVQVFKALAVESDLLMTGGSDFHGINVDTEREPGQIALPERALNAFLDLALEKWEAPVLSQVDAAISAKESSMVVWEKQVDLVTSHLETKHPEITLDFACLRREAAEPQNLFFVPSLENFVMKAATSLLESLELDIHVTENIAEGGATIIDLSPLVDKYDGKWSVELESTCLDGINKMHKDADAKVDSVISDMHIEKYYKRAYNNIFKEFKSYDDETPHLMNLIRKRIDHFSSLVAAKRAKQMKTLIKYAKEEPQFLSKLAIHWNYETEPSSCFFGVQRMLLGQKIIRHWTNVTNNLKSVDVKEFDELSLMVTPLILLAKRLVLN